MGRNIPLSVSQAWFTALFYWTPLLGTLCSAVFFALFFSCNIQCVAHPAGAGWRPTASDVMCERRGPRIEGRSPRVVGERPSYSLFFFKGALKGSWFESQSSVPTSGSWQEPPYGGGTLNTWTSACKCDSAKQLLHGWHLLLQFIYCSCDFFPCQAG